MSQKNGKQKDVTCRVCGKRYRTLRADHLRSHGLTRERYQRIYGARLSRSADGGLAGSADQSSGASGDPHLAMIARLSTAVADSTGFLDALASECADHILSAAPLRQQVAFAAAQVVQARVKIHADAVGRLARVTSELDAPWRIAAGGANGKPTSTRDLLGIAMQAHAEVVKAEEMVLKAARLALDERKAEDALAAAPGYTYSGAAEGIAIPRDLSAPDREALRALMGNLTRHVEVQRSARQAITMTVEADGAAGEVADQSDPSEDLPAGTPPIATTGGDPVVARPVPAEDLPGSPDRRDGLQGPPGDPLATPREPLPSRRGRRTA